jgi:hypothetical protein
MRPPAKALFLIAALLGVLTGSVPLHAQGKSRITCYTAFDENFLYIAAVVDKPTLQGTQANPFGDPLKDDSVAVYLQREGEGDKPARMIVMAVSVAGGAQLYRGPQATPLRGFQDFLTADNVRIPFKYGVEPRGEIGRPNANNGYTVEMAIPWIELGGQPPLGQRVRFNVVAYSAASDTSAFLSLFPGVKTPSDALKPAQWGEMIFVDAAVNRIASAPEAKVCARVFTARPVINGIVSQGEWNSLTSFAFAETGMGGSAVAVSPSAVTPRVAPNVTLKPARPPIKPPARREAALTARTPQSVPALIFSLYQIHYQADPRKAMPVSPIRAANGASLLKTHPLEGAGPWFSYDRVDWHRAQLNGMRQAGIHVALATVRAGDNERLRTLRGLTVLAGALRSMEASNLDYPLIGLYMETPTLTNAFGGRLDLRDPSAQARLYTAIKDFYLAIPQTYRASIPLEAKNGGGVAHVVVLSTASAFSDLDSSFVDYCRKQFLSDFGADLLILGGSDFKGKAKLDGYIGDPRAYGFQMDSEGWIRPAVISVSAPSETKQAMRGDGAALASAQSARAENKAPGLLTRGGGEVYKRGWREALSRQAQWVFLNSWNDFAAGNEIAPTQEHGITYADLTRALSYSFANTGQLRAAVISHNVPRAVPAKTTCFVSVRVLNSGSAIWTPEAFSLIYRWKRADGSEVGQPRYFPMRTPIIPGKVLALDIPLVVPAEAGAYNLVVDLAQVGKKGDVLAYFSGLGNVPLTTSVLVTSGPDPKLSDYGISLIYSDLPKTLESGGTYTARIAVRNDGAKPWVKAEGMRVVARVWRYVSPLNRAGKPESYGPVEMADASAELTGDVLPGQAATLSVPITFSRPDGVPLEVTTGAEADGISYHLRWEISASADGIQGAVSDPEAFALNEMDAGIQFSADQTPPSLPAKLRIPVTIGLRNRGPQIWKKDGVRIGYHWYFQDGTEALWENETTPLPKDLAPGENVEMTAWVTAPPDDGIYWLVWDMKVGDVWASTMPSARPFETRVHRIQVVRGRLHFVDLDRLYNVDGIAGETERADGNFDGLGRSLPAELAPPFANDEMTASTLWLPVRGTGLDATRRISFRWGPKGTQEKNVLQCVGQRIPVVADARKAEVFKTVHILAAATKDNARAALTLVFVDGSEQYTSFPVSRWDKPPAFGEEVAFISRYTRTRFGDDAAMPVSVFRYSFRIPEAKKLSAITLPNEPGLNILAITLER